MDLQTLTYYQNHAVEVTRRYESADPTLIHDNLLRAFSPGSNLLETGVGSGRDASFLSSRGYIVAGTDASLEMIAEAVRLHPELDRRLFHSSLPDPLPFDDESFDGAYAIAILMHIPKELVDSSLLELARVIRPGGQFLFSIPALRKDPIVDDRDTDGRLFTTLDPTDWIDTASRAGFSLIETMLDPDCLNRSGFSWQTFLFSR